jgi:hypothetical protein
MGKWSEQIVLKEAQMANKHMRTCSTSLVLKEMQIKTTLAFHFTPVRMAGINNTNNMQKKRDPYPLLVGK